jgi:hypothetical protein
MTRYTWGGEQGQPMSYNAWLYAMANPINYYDPSGLCPDNDGDGKCDSGWWCEKLPPPQRELCLENASCGGGGGNFDNDDKCNATFPPISIPGIRSATLNAYNNIRQELLNRFCWEFI